MSDYTVAQGSVDELIGEVRRLAQSCRSVGSFAIGHKLSATAEHLSRETGVVFEQLAKETVRANEAEKANRLTDSSLNEALQREHALSEANEQLRTEVQALKDYNRDQTAQIVRNDQGAQGRIADQESRLSTAEKEIDRIFNAEVAASNRADVWHQKAEALADALESAKNGLDWYRGEHPQDESPADDEMAEQIVAALTAARTDATDATGKETDPGFLERVIDSQKGPPSNLKLD